MRLKVVEELPRKSCEKFRVSHFQIKGSRTEPTRRVQTIVAYHHNSKSYFKARGPGFLKDVTCNFQLFMSRLIVVYILVTKLMFMFLMPAS